MRRGRPPFPDVLTPRESEVLALLREGLTNEQIAGRLGISESGARYHVSEILSKLGVSSREEAARWQPGLPAPGIGVLARLRNSAGGAAHSAAFVPIVLAVALLVALALGLVVMNTRSGGSGADGTVAIGRDGEEASVRMLRDLAAEATQDARTVLPGAELVFVAYATHSGFYTFRFSQPGSRAEVSILGPHVGVPGVARWERMEEERPVDSPALLPLDLSAVQNSFAAVAEAAASESRSLTDTPKNMGVLLFDDDDGTLTWNTTARLSQDVVIRCETPDANLSSMTCVP
jgi:DNA-binding CsgD family transcriptional regulator